MKVEVLWTQFAFWPIDLLWYIYAIFDPYEISSTKVSFSCCIAYANLSSASSVFRYVIFPFTNQKAMETTSMAPKTPIAQFMPLGLGFGLPGKKKNTVVIAQ